MSDPFVDVFKHHLWANVKVLDACKALSDDAMDEVVPGVYGSIRNTLVHLFAAETRYVAAMRNEPRPDELHEDKPFPGIAVLRTYARKTGEELMSFAASVTVKDRIRGESRGVAYDLPMSIPLAQSINHGAEHRTNITTIMSARGLNAPEVDVWAYARELSGERARS